MHRGKPRIFLVAVMAALVAAVYFVWPHLAGSAHRMGAVSYHRDQFIV
jgi:hypothetical protein